MGTYFVSYYAQTALYSEAYIYSNYLIATTFQLISAALLMLYFTLLTTRKLLGQKLDTVTKFKLVWRRACTRDVEMIGSFDREQDPTTHHF